MVLHSYAKLNLYLAVLNKRKDNYHNLSTLFERISLADRITIKARQDKVIRFFCRNKAVPCDEANLCFRSAKLLQEKLKVNKGADITLTKRIPVGAGLGGGSSNAATTLLGLNKLWRLNLSRRKLAELGGRLGADIPFFIYDTPFAEGQSRGDKIKPLRALNKLCLWHILVVPKLHVATPVIYREFDKGFFGLTKPVSDVKILTSVLLRKDLSGIAGFLFNSLEAVTTRLYPRVKKVKDSLIALGIGPVQMSGSGPSVFGILPSKREALFIAGKLKQECKPLRVFVVRTF